MIPGGIPAPDIQNMKFLKSENFGADTVSYYRKPV
jgi:hypothetical protein